MIALEGGNSLSFKYNGVSSLATAGGRIFINTTVRHDTDGAGNAPGLEYRCILLFENGTARLIGRGGTNGYPSDLEPFSFRSSLVDHAGYLYWGTAEGLRRSDDGGGHFMFVEGSRPPEGASIIALHGVGSKLFAATDGLGLYAWNPGESGMAGARGAENAVRIVPNPAGSMAAVEIPADLLPVVGEVQLRLINVYGVVVRSFRHPVPDGPSVHLQLDDVPAGSYLLTIEVGGRMNAVQLRIVR